MSAATGIANVCRHGIVHGGNLMPCVICYQPTPLGWQCPRCRAVNAPHVNQCACAPGLAWTVKP